MSRTLTAAEQLAELHRRLAESLRIERAFETAHVEAYRRDEFETADLCGSWQCRIRAETEAIAAEILAITQQGASHHLEGRPAR